MVAKLGLPCPESALYRLSRPMPVARAILVGVLPDGEVGKLRVLGVELAIMVAVKGLGQARQVGGGFALCGGGGVVLGKGELRVVMHLAVVVFVPDQLTVLRTGPAGGVELAVAVDIHHHVAVVLKKIDPLRGLYTPAPRPVCKTQIQNSNVERQISKRLRKTQLTIPARPRNS
jgi:hypothetical protein